MRPRRSGLWQRWLELALWGTMAFSLVPLLVPSAARRVLSWLVLGNAGALDRANAHALAYIDFIDGVLAAVMLGWSVALLALVRGAFRQRRRRAWNALALSLAIWFIPGCLLSLYRGVWRNLILDLAFAAVFAIPLLACRRECARSESP